MKWAVIVVLAAVAGTWASEVDISSVTFPELAPRSLSRIVSGWEAREGQIPFQLSLRMVSAIGNVFACGASLIHHEWALTAAHCTANRPTLVVRAGVTNLTRPEMMFETTQWINHPLYDENIAGIVQPHDIGLIKFPIAVRYSNLIQPVRIQRSADRNKNYDEVRLVASGWGALWSSGASPEVLNWVYLRGVTNTFCRNSFGGSQIVQDSTICARFYNVTSQSTCQGDSGGPLAVVEEDGKQTVIGVTSFVSGLGCHVGFPAGFIRPGFYHNWFHQVTGINFDWDWPEEEIEGSGSEESGNIGESESSSSESDSSSSDSDSSSSDSDSSSSDSDSSSSDSDSSSSDSDSSSSEESRQSHL